MAARRHPLEAAAAMALGELLICWSRIDLAVQLYVDSLPGDRPPAKTFDARLEHLLDLADSQDEKPLRAEFVRWIGAARQSAQLAASVRAGRWLPDPRSNVVLLLGHGRYTIAQLEEALVTQRRLLGDLHRLCAAERHLSPERAASFLATQPIDVVEQAG